MHQRRPARTFTRRQLLATGGALCVPAALLAWWQPWQAPRSSPDDPPHVTATPPPPAATRAPERIALPTALPASPAATPTTPATPVALRATGTILYLGSLDRQAGIIAVSADGSGQRLLVPGEYRGIAWSPGGERFAAVGPLRSGFTDQVAIFDAEGRPLGRYAFEGIVGDQPLWSPNGDALACSVYSYSAGPGQPGRTESWQITMWGDVRRVVLPVAGSVVPFAWTPGGLLTVVGNDESGQRVLWTASADGTHAVREATGRFNPIALTPDGETLYAIEWATRLYSDGRLIAIALRSDTRHPIIDADRLGGLAFGGLTVPGAFTIYSATLAPNGRHLAAVIEHVQTAGVPSPPERSVVFLWPNGIVDGSLRLPSDISRLPNGNWPGPFAWSPDGTMLAFGSTGGTLTIADMRGKRLVEAPFSATTPYDGMALSWSPDGRWLAYAHLNGVTVMSPAGLPSYELFPVGGALAWQPRRPR